jgi:hypothetical protein
MKSGSQEAKFAMTRRFSERWLEALKAQIVGPLIDGVLFVFTSCRSTSAAEDRGNIGKVVLAP